MIFCYKYHPKTTYVWIDGIKNAERIIYGPFISWKQAVVRGDEMLGKNNYNLYLAPYSNMKDFVNSLKFDGRMQDKEMK